MKDNEIRKLESEMHHEFQLERVILFSDAVFAIAITLMVIELKFPEIEKNETAHEFWMSVIPVIRNFIALMISFIFIGMYWYRHLKLCGLLIDFNRGFIALNLLFLFFIVLFPFSVSSMMHMGESAFHVAAFVYFGNIFFTTVAHFVLYVYLLGKGKSICKPVSEVEKKILLENSFIPIVLISLLFIALFLTLFVFKDNPEYTGLIFLPAAVLAFGIRRRFRRRHKKLREAITIGK